MLKGKYDAHDKNLLTVLANSSTEQPSPASQYRHTFVSCNRNEPKQCTSTWQIKEVSDSIKHADTVNSLLTDTSIRWIPGAGPGCFSVINF